MKTLNTTKDDFIYSSNPLLLDWKDWVITIVLLTLVSLFVPLIWRKKEILSFDKNFRIQKSNSQDYWLLQSVMDKASAQNKIIFIGDSAIWGHYVEKNTTLTAEMNKIEKNDKFLNLGVSGLHNASLNGLVQYYGENLKDGFVIIQFAPLWIMNPKKDLSDPKIDRGKEINHSKLLPQFLEMPPQYSAGIENRLSICLARFISIFSLTEHWTIQSTEGKPFSQWVIQNPYSNPFSKINLNLNEISSNDKNESELAWFNKPGLKQSNIPWVLLKDSFQWKEFLKTVRILKSRNNKVFVYLGPFNKNMLNDLSLIRYKEIQEQSQKILSDNGIPFHWAIELNSDQYGDESHPLKDGYESLANDLITSSEFKNWMKGEKNE